MNTHSLATRHLPATAARITAVALLTPVVVIAGVVAVVALPALSLTRRVAAWIAGRRPAAVAPVLQLDPASVLQPEPAPRMQFEPAPMLQFEAAAMLQFEATPAESSLAVARRRAA